MKKIILLFALFSFIRAEAQISNEQWTLITKKSADWCTPCGTWAWDAFDEIIDDMENKNAIMITMHHSGGLLTETGKAITANFGGFYQPVFYLNDEIQNILSSNVDAKRQELIEQVDLLSLFPAFAGVDVDAYIDADGTTLKTQINVEFFEDLSNDNSYSLGVYLIRNDIMSNQAGQGVVLHHKVLSDKLTNDHFGDVLDASKGMQSLSYEYDVTDMTDMEIVAIIWLKDSQGKYRVFNAGIKDQIDLLLSSNELEKELSDFSSSFSNDQLLLDFNLLKSKSKAEVVLVDITGKQLASQSIDALLVGNNKVSLEIPSVISGVYVVSMIIDGKRISQKVLKK